METIKIRNATIQDVNQILHLYQNVSSNTTGLARSFDEINVEYIEKIVKNSKDNGLQFIIEDIKNASIIAEIHCYKLGLKVFNHILSELTIAVAPEYQGQGYGELIFNTLIDNVIKEHSDILRIELIVRESNFKAIKLYEKIGFKKEGRFENRISTNKQFEADIPMAWFNATFKP